MVSKELDKFLEILPKVPFLKNVTKYNKRDPEVYRHFRWETWIGPESPSGYTYGNMTNAWCEQLVDNQGDLAQTLFRNTKKQVLEIARKNVPEFSEDQDSWHAPTVAVYSASFFAGLMVCAIAQNKVHPLNIEHQWTLEYFWSWYVEGHWPSGVVANQTLEWDEEMRNLCTRIYVL